MQGQTWRERLERAGLVFTLGEVADGSLFYVVNVAQPPAPNGKPELLFSGAFTAKQAPGSHLLSVTFHGEDGIFERDPKVLGIGTAYPWPYLCLHSLMMPEGRLTLTDSRPPLAKAKHSIVPQ
ncbi:MAG TPA: hypothetical protein VLA88_02710 [Candidatus Saccharimonadales bacterium]|nr:hypothetical protein [Candidatus Saccharimonadales bacterium]